MEKSKYQGKTVEQIIKDLDIVKKAIEYHYDIETEALNTNDVYNDKILDFVADELAENDNDAMEYEQYEKIANLNALIHEQGKRTCWCAQEAIYHISCDLRRDLAQYVGENAKVMKYLTPPCLSRGKCAEGARYCGRDIANKINYFRQRQI